MAGDIRDAEDVYSSNIWSLENIGDDLVLRVERAVYASMPPDSTREANDSADTIPRDSGIVCWSGGLWRENAIK